MGLSRRMGTTSRFPVPRGLYEECKRQYLGDILEVKTKYNIPAELILNSDQTPSSYVSVGKSGITAIMNGSVTLPSSDPFAEAHSHTHSSAVVHWHIE